MNNKLNLYDILSFNDKRYAVVSMTEVDKKGYVLLVEIDEFENPIDTVTIKEYISDSIGFKVVDIKDNDLFNIVKMNLITAL